MIDLWCKREISNSKKKLERVENSSVNGVMGNLSSSRAINCDLMNTRLSDVKEHIEAKSYIKGNCYEKQSEKRLSFTKLSKDLDKENRWQNSVQYDSLLFTKSGDKNDQNQNSKASKVLSSKVVKLPNTPEFSNDCGDLK